MLKLAQIWKKHGASWQSRFPWLCAEEGEDGNISGLGCAICREQPQQNAFASCTVGASSAQTSVFQKHEQSSAHQMRAESMAGELGVPIAAPSERQFADVLDSVFKGDPEIKEIGPSKFRAMVWCLAEARRRELRSRLGTSICMSLQQDVREGQLLVTFASANEQLQLTTGVLGQVSLPERFGGNAKDIFQASVYVLNKFTTKNLGKPGRDGHSDGAELDEQLTAHIRGVVELYAADGAADEQRAIKLLPAYFGGLKVMHFDKAHACQRILSRTWPCDPYIKELVERLVTGQDALTMKIRHSLVFRKRFQTAISDLSPGQARRIKNLSCAKHRYLSKSLPFRRCVLFFKPLVRVAQAILQERGRSSEEGQIARRWLERVTPESALQIALVADASDEARSVSQFFDADNYSKSEMTAHVSKFLCKVTWLFEDSQGAKQTGFTRFMLDQLRTPINISVDGHLRSVGVPSDQEMTRCFQRMVSWLQLVRLTVKAELPSFESLQLFRIFDLEVNPSAHDLRRFANMLDLDAEAFRAEFHDLRPSADWHYRNGCSSSQAAWLLAVQKTKGTSTLMVAALARDLAWQANTCGIERNFSKALVSTSRCRADVSEPRLDDEVQLISLCQQSRGKARALPKHQKLIESARLLWSQEFGAPRERRPLAPHEKGLRKRLTDGNSEAAFLKKRRLEVAEAAREVDRTAACTPVPQVVGRGGWEESHETEKKFLENKFRARFLQAIREGAVPWSDLSAPLRELYLRFEEHDQKLSADAMKRESFQFKRPNFPDLSGGTVWWTEEVQESAGEVFLRQVARKLGLRVVENRRDATAHVWRQLTEPGSHHDMWAVALHGKFVMDLRCFRSQGKAGGFLVYKAAIGVQRTVFISPRFARDHAHIAREILSFCKPFYRGISKWRSLNDAEAFRRTAQQAITAKKPTTVLAFGTDEDEPDWGHLKLFLKSGDLSRIMSWDAKSSSLGLDK
ncbi:unnamed protein product [Symbiodinium microadriaticum]|nr:unnamed protein product [Symbiodinium sp. KB8]CAE7439886.1 unnamed protein product [Symbiodinium microadriaticum]